MTVHLQIYLYVWKLRRMVLQSVASEGSSWNMARASVLHDFLG
jgi:hypothetical protein